MSPIERSAGGGGGGFTNPMTTAGDIIIENAVPAPARLGIGTTGQVLGVTAGLPAWQSGGGLVKLFDSTLGADGTFDTGAGGIAAGHGDLIVYFMGRSDRAATADNVSLQFNADTGANYDTVLLRNVFGVVSATSSAGITSYFIGQVCGSTADANVPGACTAVIPAYTGTTFHKVGTSNYGYQTVTAADNGSGMTNSTWHNTAAITRIKCLPTAGGTNFKTGSRLVIYGAQ